MNTILFDQNKKTLSMRLGMIALLLVTLFVGSFQRAQAQSSTSTATVTTDKDDYAPGEYVIITGTGWQPGETVTLHFDEDPKPVSCLKTHDMTVVADAEGKIYNGDFFGEGKSHWGSFYTYCNRPNIGFNCEGLFY